LRKDFHPTCSRCGEPLKSWKLIEAHHIIPVSQGGPDTDENVTLVHSKCHLEIHVEMAEAARSSM
jgi:5-methylcytosine-specific restriction endonuclease McrA